MCSPSRYDVSAPARSPSATCMSPTLLYETDRSRCERGIAGIGFRQPVGNGETVAVGLERAGKIPPELLHVADLDVRHQQIALPTGIAGIGFRQPVGNGEIVAIGRERARKVALRQLHVADLFVRNRQIALPDGVARI